MSHDMFLPHYIVYRKDRTLTFKDKPVWGVFLPISNKFVTSEIKIEENCEATFAQIDMVGSSKLIIGTFYIPPFTDEQYTDTYCGVVEEKTETNTAHFILGGDYNVGDIDLETLSVRPGGRDVALCNQYIQTLANYINTASKTPIWTGSRLSN